MAYVSSSPHVSDKTTTRTIMLDVIFDEEAHHNS